MNMFDLESAIAEWRQEMEQAGIGTPAPLEELEAHLREAFAQHIQAGRNEADAFALAVQRLGQASVVRDEFKKLNRTNATSNWALDAILTLLAIAFPLWVSAMIFYFKAGVFPDLTGTQKFSAVAATAFFAITALGGRIGYPIFPSIEAKKRRTAITLACTIPVVVWWLTFFNVIAPRWELNMAQLILALLWLFIAPAGIMMGILWGLETAARKKHRTEHAADTQIPYV